MPVPAAVLAEVPQLLSSYVSKLQRPNGLVRDRGFRVSSFQGSGYGDRPGGGFVS